jgi:hypothetical protein
MLNEYSIFLFTLTINKESFTDVRRVLATIANQAIIAPNKAL